MKDEFQMHDVVVLLEDMQVNHFETRQPLMLRRGQVGAIVMTYNGTAYEVEFADREGRPYAILPIAPQKLVLLKDTPELVAR